MHSDVTDTATTEEEKKKVRDHPAHNLERFDSLKSTSHLQIALVAAAAASTPAHIVGSPQTNASVILFGAFYDQMLGSLLSY